MNTAELSRLLANLIKQGTIAESNPTADRVLHGGIEAEHDVLRTVHRLQSASGYLKTRIAPPRPWVWWLPGKIKMGEIC